MAIYVNCIHNLRKIYLWIGQYNFLELNWATHTLKLVLYVLNVSGSNHSLESIGSYNKDFPFSWCCCISWLTKLVRITSDKTHLWLWGLSVLRSRSAGKTPGRVLADSVRKSAVCATMLVLHPARTLWIPSIPPANQEPASTALQGCPIPKLSSAHREKSSQAGRGYSAVQPSTFTGNMKSEDETDCFGIPIFF